MARRGVCQSAAEFLSRQHILFGAGLAALAACSASRASYLRALLTVFVLISVCNGHLATRQNHATAIATAYLHYNLLVNDSMAEVVRVLMKSGRASVSKYDRPRDNHDKSFMDYMYVWQSMDDKHFKDIFRVNSATFKIICDYVRPIVRDNTSPLQFEQWSNLNWTMEFKVAVYLYYIGHSVDFGVMGHIAGIGTTTARNYVKVVSLAVLKTMQPICMSGLPPSPHELHETFETFKVRRGMYPVAMTVDGTHVPWWPSDSKERMYYCNFKGWFSLNVLAWVSQNYTFIDAEIGHCARVGDTTMTEMSAMARKLLTDRMAWLEPNGFILGDGGFSLADIMMVPYANPF